MGRYFIAVAFFAVFWLATGASNSYAAPCLIVTLTGTQGGPQSFNGLAGAGTLVRFGDDADECEAIKLQFDAGRGTTMRLSQLKSVPSSSMQYSSRICTTTTPRVSPIWFSFDGHSMEPDRRSTPSAARIASRPRASP